MKQIKKEQNKINEKQKESVKIAKVVQEQNNKYKETLTSEEEDEQIDEQIKQDPN